jgi:hypothetical protein
MAYAFDFSAVCARTLARLFRFPDPAIPYRRLHAQTATGRLGPFDHSGNGRGWHGYSIVPDAAPFNCLNQVGLFESPKLSSTYDVEFQWRRSYSVPALQYFIARIGYEVG